MWKYGNKRQIVTYRLFSPVNLIKIAELGTNCKIIFKWCFSNFIASSLTETCVYKDHVLLYFFFCNLFQVFHKVTGLESSNKHFKTEFQNFKVDFPGDLDLSGENAISMLAKIYQCIVLCVINQLKSIYLSCFNLHFLIWCPPLFFGNLVVETLLCGGRNMAVNGNVSFRGEGLNNLVLTCSEVNINPFAFVSNV